MTDKEIKDLAFKFFQREITQEEEEILHQWYEEKDIPKDRYIVQTEDESKDDMSKRLFASIEVKKDCENPPVTIRRLSKKNWISVIAASLLLFVSIGSIYFYFHKPIEEPIHYTKLLKGDVGPGGNNAILELADGSIINLDSAAIGELGSIGSLRINKQDNGLVSIEVASSYNNAVAEKNTIRTPAGGQYQVKLPDGTRIWLNASSSITFSNVLKEYREVELSGEAYFEVAKFQAINNKSIPFFVINKNQRIEVLGTHFNVYDYPGETIETTLLEGSVRIHSLESSNSRVLKPGQQSKVANGAIEIKEADLESSLSWKNGDFIFNNEEISRIMKKLERWYDVEVEYSSTFVPRKFSGAVSRSKNLSEVLKIMEFTGNITFKIEGRRVTVMM